MGDFADWDGLVRGSRNDTADISLVAPLSQGSRGGSTPFLGKADDGQQYWIKVANNAQGPRVLINEQIVGRLCPLLHGGPGCVVKTILLSNDVAGWEYANGRRLEVGVAHASLEVTNCDQTHELTRRADDDNARRHAMIYALYDWCYGSDPQWLVSFGEDNKYYSHDHGFYFPGGPNWTVDSLKAHIDTANELQTPPTGVDASMMNSLADILDGLSRNAIATALRPIPSTWPVTDEELEHLGYFLERRAPQVAARLRARI